MSNATVTYLFNTYSLSVNIVVSTQLQNFKDVDGKSFPGYAIISGTGHYTPTGGSPLSFNVSPQTVNPCNVLWQYSDDGSGGSSYGIDMNGIDILGDDGALEWNGVTQGVASFTLQEGAIDGPVTLNRVKNWPPRG